MEWALLPLKRYATFSGRSRRKEYWLFILFTVIVSTVLSVIDTTLGFGGGARTANGMWLGARGGPLSSIFSLAMLLPTLAVAVRRLHDTDRTGWWLLAPAVMYVPLIALIVYSVAQHAPQFIGLAVVGLALLALSIMVLVFLCLPGTPGPNRFGEDPLAQTPEALGDVFR